MKQTAVEWLENELDFLSNYIDEMARFNLFKQAKEMEKAQIIDARVDGDTWSTAIKEMRTAYAELYYNETFSTNQK
jgi:hypothetical protein